MNAPASSLKKIQQSRAINDMYLRKRIVLSKRTMVFGQQKKESKSKDEAKIAHKKRPASARDCGPQVQSLINSLIKQWFSSLSSAQVMGWLGM
jgi:hypothetical protein